MVMLASQILKRSTKLCSAKALLPSFSARSSWWMSKQLAFMKNHSLDEDLPKDYNIFSWMPTPRDCLKDLKNVAELTEKWDKVMEEAKKLSKEAKSEPCAYGHLYKFLMSEEMKIARNKLPEIIYEEMWNFARAQAEKKVFEGGSLFCFTMWGGRASIDNPYLNVENKVLETYLRCRKDIKHYMEWHSQDYPTLLEPYESLFDKLPYSCLVRGLQLHISRIPYKYTKESLPEVLKKGMLRKLKKDYKLLIEKINYMQLFNIPQATMVREINTLVRHYAANPGYSHVSLDHDASSTRCEYEVGSYQVPYVGLSTF